MHLYRAGMPLVLLSEFLGHADVNTTRIYAWADTEMKRQAIQKVSKATAEDSIEPIWANDEEMIKRLYTLEDMGYDVERLRPEGKDWNDDLRAKRGGHG